MCPMQHQSFRIFGVNKVTKYHKPKDLSLYMELPNKVYNLIITSMTYIVQN